MYALENLKEMLCRELDEIAERQELNAGDLETIHKLTDTIKNIDKIEMFEDEDGYSERGSYSRGDSYSSRRGRSRYSSARGGNGGGRSGGSYSRSGGNVREELERLMDEAGSEKERAVIRRCMELME